MKLKEVIRLLSEFRPEEQELEVSSVIVDSDTTPSRVRLHDGRDGEPFAIFEGVEK